MCLKKIHPGSFFPDQQLYTRISVSTKYAAGSFMNNDLKTPAAPSEGNCIYDKQKRFIHDRIMATPLHFLPRAVSGVGKMLMYVGVNINSVCGEKQNSSQTSQRLRGCPRDPSGVRATQTC